MSIKRSAKESGSVFTIEFRLPDGSTRSLNFGIGLPAQRRKTPAPGVSRS